MGLELVLGYEEEDDNVRRFTVQGLKVNAGLGTPEAGRDLGYGITAGVRDGNAEPYARAHGLLTVTEGVQRLSTIGLVEMSFLDQTVNNLREGLPPVGGDHLGDNQFLG